MRTLVIGARAFVGRRIVHLLVNRGHDVSVLHRRDQHDLGPAVRNLQADRADWPTLRRLIRSEPTFDGPRRRTRRSVAAAGAAWIYSPVRPVM